MKNQSTPRLLLSTVVLALGLAAGAPAIAAGNDGAPAMQMSEHATPRGGQAMRGLARLHDELKLDARQEALWKEAANASREAHAGMRARLAKEREETLAMLNQPGADLRAVVKRGADLRAEMRKQHEATRDHWLALYDTMNAEQKEKARIFVKTMFEHRQHRMQHEHHGEPRR